MKRILRCKSTWSTSSVPEVIWPLESYRKLDKWLIPKMRTRCCYILTKCLACGATLRKKNPQAMILCLEHKMMWGLRRCMTADGRVHALHQSRIELALLCDPAWSAQKQQSFCRSICCRGCLTPGRFVKTVPLQSSEFTRVKHIWNEWDRLAQSSWCQTSNTNLS